MNPTITDPPAGDLLVARANTMLHGCAAFGAVAVSPLPLPGMTPLNRRPEQTLDLQFSTVADEPGVDLWETILEEGERVRASECTDGAHLLRYGTADRFRIARSGSAVTCEMSGTPGAQRFLLDTVLWWSALLRGLFIQHAAVLARDDRAVAIEAPSGTGKTTLALALIARGWRLVSDDVLVFARPGTRPLTALAGPPLMNVRPGGESTQGFHGRAERVLTPDQAASDTRLAAYAHYSRDSRTVAALDVLTPEPMALLGATWAIPGRHDAAAQFDAVCDLAQIPRWQLTLTPADPADRAAVLLEDALGVPS